jgi:hypothetical protein
MNNATHNSILLGTLHGCSSGCCRVIPKSGGNSNPGCRKARKRLRVKGRGIVRRRSERFWKNDLD